MVLTVGSVDDSIVGRGYFLHPSPISVVSVRSTSKVEISIVFVHLYLSVLVTRCLFFSYF